MDQVGIIYLINKLSSDLNFFFLKIFFLFLFSSPVNVDEE